MTKSSAKSKASSKPLKLPSKYIELAAKYMAMSNMATLDAQRIKIVDIASMERAVDAAWEIALTGTMEGMDGGYDDRNESKAIDMIEPEIKYWRKLLKKNDRYCIETLMKEVPFLFWPENYKPTILDNSGSSGANYTSEQLKTLKDKHKIA